MVASEPMRESARGEDWVVTKTEEGEVEEQSPEEGVMLFPPLIILQMYLLHLHQKDGEPKQ